MKHYFLLILCLLLVTASFALASGDGAARNAEIDQAQQCPRGKKVPLRKNVLILNSYHYGFHWTQRIMEGVHSVFDKQDSLELYIEYMDTKRISDAKYLRLYCELIKEKYRGRQMDAILSSDDHALNFLMAHRDSLFPDVPIVFCGINDYQPYPFLKEKAITGIYEEYSLTGTVKLIQGLHPLVKDVYLITDNTVSGNAFLNLARRNLSNIEQGMKLHFLHNLDTAHLVQAVKNLPPRSVIIWGIYIQAPDHVVLTSYESIQLITSNTHHPVYSLWDVVGQGVVGGKIANPVYQGSEAARTVMEILKGKDANDIPVKGTPLIDKFDALQLQRFGISKKHLPEGSLILHESNSVWEHFQIELMLILLLLCIFVFMIVSLMHLSRRTKKKEQLIRTRNQKLAQLSIALKNSNSDLLTAQQNADESNRLKSAFLANMSHKIRTPLNGILGFIQLLENEDLSLDKRKHYISVIQKSGVRMLTTVNDIIEISKIQTGQTQIYPKEVDVVHELNTLKNSYMQQAKRKGIYFRVINELKEPLLLNTDLPKFNTILSNLIKNAIDYTAAGGLTVHLLRDQDHCIIEFHDTGSGIAEESMEVIFKPFVQTPNENPDSMQGSGLGLSISRNYAELLGGSLSLKSIPDKGSTFTLSLPIELTALESITSASTLQIPLAQDHKLKVLIAEDDLYSSEFLEVMLENVSSEILHVQDGKDAVEVARKNKDLDLILMDIKLPGLNGYEAATQIRKILPGTIIIAQTAYAMVGDQQKALDAGCDGYISKPIDINKLYELIHQLCE